MGFLQILVSCSALFYSILFYSTLVFIPHSSPQPLTSHVFSFVDPWFSFQYFCQHGRTDTLSVTSCRAKFQSHLHQSSSFVCNMFTPAVHHRMRSNQTHVLLILSLDFGPLNKTVVEIYLAHSKSKQFRSVTINIMACILPPKTPYQYFSFSPFLTLLS